MSTPPIGKITSPVDVVLQGVSSCKGYTVSYTLTRKTGEIILERKETTVTISVKYKPFSDQFADPLLEKFFSVPRDTKEYGSLGTETTTTTDQKYNGMCPKCCVEHRNCTVESKRTYVGTPEQRRQSVIKVVNDTILFVISLLDLVHPVDYAIWYREKGRNMESEGKNSYERFITYVACCSIVHSPEASFSTDYKLFEFTDK
jgi:hypothetical protein